MSRPHSRILLAAAALLAATSATGCRSRSEAAAPEVVTVDATAAEPAARPPAGSAADGDSLEASATSPLAAVAPAVDPPTTPDDFLARRPLIFFHGTAGDDAADARLVTQAGLLRDLVFPDALLVPDTGVEPLKGRDGWPPHPVLYGAPHENLALAALAGELPFELTAERLVLGDERFEGDGYRLITVLPAADRHPALLLYAGTGSAGAAEINAGLPGNMPIVVADAFGTLAVGRWETVDGKLRAALGPRARRIEWRVVERELTGAGGDAKATVRFLFPAMVPEWGGETGMIEACLRGAATTVAKLGIAAPEPLSIYVYPDRRSVASLTGRQGDGWAVPSSRALHVLATMPQALESLVAHEATHVLGYFAWGPVRTPLLGEGLAVWAAGGYGGVSLNDWKTRFPTPPPVATLLGPEFLRLPEAEKYPPAGILVETAMKLVGAAAVREHLLPANAATWDDACRAAGTTAEALQAAYAAAFVPGWSRPQPATDAPGFRSAAHRLGRSDLGQAGARRDTVDPTTKGGRAHVPQGSSCHAVARADRGPDAVGLLHAQLRGPELRTDRLSGVRDHDQPALRAVEQRDLGRHLPWIALLLHRDGADRHLQSGGGGTAAVGATASATTAARRGRNGHGDARVEPARHGRRPGAAGESAGRRRRDGRGAGPPDPEPERNPGGALGLSRPADLVRRRHPRDRQNAARIPRGERPTEPRDGDDRVGRRRRDLHRPGAARRHRDAVRPGVADRRLPVDALGSA